MFVGIHWHMLEYLGHTSVNIGVSQRILWTTYSKEERFYVV